MRSSIFDDRAFRLYLWLAFGITWGAGGLGLLTGAFEFEAAPPRLHPLHYLAAFGPSIAGIIMASRTDGRVGLRKMFARAIPRLGNIPWYLAVVLIFGLVNLALVRVFAPGALAALPPWPHLLALLPATLFIDTGPLGEEFGWRGFALPRLLNAQSPFASATILGAIWFAWHLPTFFIRTLSQSELSIPLFLVNSVALSIMMTWLYLRSDGDLFLMLVTHVMANYCGALGVPFTVEVAAEVLLAALVLGCGGLRAQRTDVSLPISS